MDAGQVDRHDKCGMAGIGTCLGIRNADQHCERPAGHAVIAGEPLVAVDQPVIPLIFDARFDVPRVRRRRAWLGHRKTGADLAFEHRFEPVVFLRIGADGDKHFHRWQVGGVAIEHLGGPVDPTQRFCDRREFGIAQPGARRPVRQIR